MNTCTTGNQGYQHGSVAMDADGDFVVVWGSEHDPAGDNAGMFGQRFGP